MAGWRRQGRQCQGKDGRRDASLKERPSGGRCCVLAFRPVCSFPRLAGLRKARPAGVCLEPMDTLGRSFAVPGASQLIVCIQDSQ